MSIRKEMRSNITQIFILLLVSVFQLDAFSRYEYSFQNINKFDTHFYYYVGNDTSNFYYEISENINTGSTLIKVRNLFKDNEVDNFAEFDLRFVDAFVLADKILVLNIRNNQSYATIINKNLVIENNFEFNYDIFDFAQFNIENAFKFDKQSIICQIVNDILKLDLDSNSSAILINDVVASNQNSETAFCALVKQGNNAYLSTFGRDNKANSSNFEYVPNLRFISNQNDNFVLTPYSENTLVHFFESNFFNNSFWIDTSIELIDFSDNSFFYLTSNGSEFEIIKKTMNSTKVASQKIPSDLYAPSSLAINNQHIYIQFTNGFLILNSYLEILGIFKTEQLFVNSSKFDVNLSDKYLVLHNSQEIITFDIKYNEYSNLYSFLYDFRYILILLFIVIISYAIFRYTRKQKRLFNSLVEMDNIGLLFYVDRNGALLRANSAALRFLEIEGKIPFKKHFRYYCLNESAHQLADLIESSLELKENYSQKMSVIKNNKAYEYIFRVEALFGSTGIFRGITLIGSDITEELERQKIQVWAQLAHDMQTNLSTIRLNTQELEFDNSQTNNINRKNKILQQTNILFDRVRDIVTVGRSNQLNLVDVSSKEIASEIIDEIDIHRFSNIHFSTNITEINFRCDKQKIIRAVRNAIDNGIKAIGNENGELNLTIKKEGKHIIFAVRDTGVGMDEDTISNMMRPYFTGMGGTGLGTMIMQNVAEQHGGKMTIDSKKGDGSTIEIIIPLLKSKN